MNNKVNYVVRYNAILQAVKEQNPDQEVTEGKILFDDIKDVLDSFQTYENAIFAMETQIPIIRFRYEAEDQAYHIQKLDHARKLAHDNAMGQAAALNRWCTSFLGLDRFIDLDDEAYRGEWTEAIVEVCRQFVDAGIIKKSS